ncbi:MAG: nuclear transport factor 2 family protein [Lewinellaceae bacterium]|nr:nuclear transport factor 2 family protein [Lewinellaceae bacterium]
MDAIKKNLLETTFENFLEATVKNGPLEDLSQWVDDAVMGYGTTLDEKMLSFDEYQEKTVRQKEQAAGMEMGVVVKPVLRKTLKDESTALFVDELEITFFIGEDKHELFIRLSTVLEYAVGQWKVVHFHASKPDSTDGEKDTWYMREWERKNAELERLVAEKTAELVQKNRELEIEAALERVRARALAMHKSDELGATSLLLFDELKALGEISEQISIGIFDEENQVLNLYATLHGEQWKEATAVDLNEPLVMQKIYGGWQQHKKSIQIDLSGKELKAYNHFRSQYSNLKFPDERWVIHCAFFSKGVLSFSTTTPHDAQTMQLLERFAQVFDGTYTRFLDLQKAEAQAWEAQIEAALERVRSRAMAMRHSDELSEAAEILYNEFLKLGLRVMICRPNTDEDEGWFANEKGAFILSIFRIPRILLIKMYEGWENKLELFSEFKEGQELREHYNYMFSLPAINRSLRAFLHRSYFSHLAEIPRCLFFAWVFAHHHTGAF